MSNWTLIPTQSGDKSLLDLSLTTDQVNFPTLQPLSPSSTVMSAPLVPIIREVGFQRTATDTLDVSAKLVQGSPIELHPVPVPETPTVAKNSPPRSQPKKVNTVATKSSPVPKQAIRAKVSAPIVKSGASHFEPKRTDSRPSPPGRTSGSTVASKPGQLRWKLNKSSVFDSEEEERGAVRLARGIFDRNGLKENAFFQWGLRFIPSGPGAFRNTYRTVRIDHLPLHVTLDRILPRIRGGAIYSASLLDTRALVHSHTALIIFVTQQGALTFLRRVAREGFYVGLHAAKVHPVPTPTYVMGAEIERQITRVGRTRSVQVSSPRINLRKALQAMLIKSPCGEHVESFGERDGPGRVTIRFFSVKMAWLAFDLLTEHAGFDDCTLQFGVDPCA